MKHHPHFSHRQRPPWWPENEDWPPKRWQYMRGKPFFRRMGCFFFGFSFLAFVGLLGILRLVLAPFIDFHGSPPLARPDFIFPLGFAGFFILLAGDVALMAPGTNSGAAQKPLRHLHFRVVGNFRRAMRGVFLQRACAANFRTVDLDCPVMGQSAASTLVGQIRCFFRCAVVIEVQCRSIRDCTDPRIAILEWLRRAAWRKEPDRRRSQQRRRRRRRRSAGRSGSRLP